MDKHSCIGIGMVVAMMTACSANQHELARRVSPDQKKLVAVLMESGHTDASQPVTDELYLNDQGLPLQLDTPVLKAHHCDGVTFSWINEYTVEIRYPTVCAIDQFTNRWQRPSDVTAGHENPVEIILARG